MAGIRNRTPFVLLLYVIQANSFSNYDNETGFGYSPIPNTSVYSQKLSIVDTDLKDNHKPEFKDCSNYKPTLKEEQPRGTFVIKVHAIDKDPKDAGGTVTYKIVLGDGVRKNFDVDEHTGEITTNSVFDRDEPSRQKELYISVIATDNGRPLLADICTFKVTIEDINDNDPVFDQASYKEQVAEDLKENGEVMRVLAYDYDDGENSRLTYDLISKHYNNGDPKEYFRIDPKTGVIYLKKSLNKKKDDIFHMQVSVQDHGNPPKSALADVDIEVVDSRKKAPVFEIYPKNPITLKEDFYDFDEKIAVFKARSNTEQTSLQFELLKGKTTQTNKDQTFKLTQEGETEAYISLARNLDYERVTEYQLTVRVTNKEQAASVTFEIKIEDVNDEIPTFIDSVTGSVLENEQPGAQVMQVRAIDKDGTSANNIVSYELQNFKDLFKIDEKTGKITTLQMFDREAEDFYNVLVVAKDNSPSAILKNKLEPNSASQAFRITIEDRNDNKPQFTNSTYVADNILETTDKGKDVIEVKAVDKDTASLIVYSIIDGNINDAFTIENTTGRIRVNNKLDFETIEQYKLIVQASDGIYMDSAKVIINIGNVNDELPVFEEYNKNITIEEEKIIEGCILNLRAYDPDIKDRNADQNIVYKIMDNQKSFLSINNAGCVSLIKALDRDKPNGFPKHQAYVYAHDDGGAPGSQLSIAEFNIILLDINDNAPFLNVTEVVWYENQKPGPIIQLTADDYDSPENGPPFSYAIANEASSDIRRKFSIHDDILNADVTFDREEQKFYLVPIAVTDSGSPSPATATSFMKVIIGDVNDNEAKPGESQIFVYNYEGKSPDVSIGRVYVDDLDDWDLNDKYFQWASFEDEHFTLNNDNGTIIMKSGTPAGKYMLNFIVTEEHLPLIPRHEVEASVEVTVKEIPEEAVRKSGSIRLSGITIEDFIAKDSNGVSRKDLFQAYFAKVFNKTLENVDVFTVIPTPSNSSYIDVRFSAHGSPYYLPESLNSKTYEHQVELEDILKAQFVLISINECLKESVCPEHNSCNNRLDIKDTAAVVFTNKTSFVGINAIVEPICDCLPLDSIQPIDDELCYSNGITFTGNGWALYPPFEACNKSEIRLEVLPQHGNGLIIYAGPFSTSPEPIVRDFMSLELQDGYPVLLVDFGTGTTMKFAKKQLTVGQSHSISILLQPFEIQLIVDDCHQSTCVALGKPPGENALLNVNGLLQVGGVRSDLDALSKQLQWNYTPTNKGFVGWIHNFTFNGQLYNLGMPAESLNAHRECNFKAAKAVSFGIDTNFIVAILVCVAILLILLLAVVVHRRKQDNWNEKDSDDIRETIINYEDEGGGEYDTGFDMSVLRREHLEDKAPVQESLYKQADVPDISGFLTDKKDSCDRDHMPYDDVRYYAYEGDGNSSGSLSSLASCTDEGDLKFNYLSNFGPRFRKLADMYGEDPSDEDSQDGGEESWC
ncbi:hypothetical protein PPYR_05825 [Photinus pyralis]|uniref:DE-cadherin n=1 Tax=Photinus pyralis TaxID=7054 RepID=A0A1Y1MV89_PHOPY|nr:DE-cadherin [Photinus pyralis]KAB0801471.1 hypothetical protein PPYR_05825 [Photinus pyralis]